MPIDASIALQTRLPEIDSPLNALAKASQVKNAMNQNRLFDMKVAADQRQQEKQNALMQVNRDSIDPVTGLMDTNKRRQGLARLGDYDALQAFEKDQADLLKTSADTGKVKADTGKTEWETQKDKAEFSVNRISGLLTKPVITDSDIATISQEFMSYPGSDALQVLKMVASLPPESDQAGRRTAIEAMRMGNMKALDQLKYTRPDADTIATNQTSRANNAASVAATVRGQNMTDARARESAAATRELGGKPPPGYRFTQDGSLQAIPGGPADIKAGAEAAKKNSEALDVLNLLDEADAILPQATGGYLGMGADIVASSFGASTEGAKATAQLKALQGALVAKMPKMTGPQSDKDVLLYREMAGQIGDPSIPVPQRQAASAMIRKLNEKYAGMKEGASKAGGDGWSVVEVKK